MESIIRGMKTIRLEPIKNINPVIILAIVAGMALLIYMVAFFLGKKGGIKKEGQPMKRSSKKAVMAILFALLMVPMLAGKFGVMDAEAAKINAYLEKGEKVSYLNYSTHYFYVTVDGVKSLAYCLEPHKDSPETGNYAAQILQKDRVLWRALYYAYGSPGYDEYIKPKLTSTWNNSDMQYCLSHCFLSYIYDNYNSNSDAFKGLNEEWKNMVVYLANYIKGLPNPPDAKLEFSEKNLVSYFDKANEIQRTQSITLKGDTRNSITINLQHDVTLVNITKGTRSVNKAVINGGDTFYLYTDVTKYNENNKWTTGSVYGSVRNSWRSIAFETTATEQVEGSGSWATDPVSPVSLNVEWLEKPDLIVDKSADKESKHYKVGDIITYTMEVTQQIERAVARNIRIRDTIITEGVKLQKTSVVLLDQDGNVINDAKITIKGNSFTIATGDSLKYLENVGTGQKFFVEYQVAITSEDVIGREIKNEVVVDADNADESDDDETVDVPDSEQGETWISKKDITNEEELPGATLQILDLEENILEEWVSTTEPHKIQLKPNDYILRETICPDGYLISSDVEFTVEKSTVVQKVIMYDDYTKIDVLKLDAKTEKLIKGAVMVVKDSEGNIIDKWESTNDAHRINRLKPGDYILIEQTAPDGYEKAEDVKFTVEDTGEVQVVKMYDEPVIPAVPVTPPAEVVQTGDTSRIMLYGSLLLFALLLSVSLRTPENKNN